MRTTLLAAALAPTAALAAIQPRNFIFIIPDGFETRFGEQTA